MREQKRKAPPGGPPTKSRLQFEIRRDEQDELDRIKRRSGIRTYSEALRIGLKILDRFLQYKEEGYSIVIVKNGETKQIELLW